MSEPNVYEQLAGMTIERDAAHAVWLDWLVKAGYGIDYSHDIDPPCTLTDLANAYMRATPDDYMTVRDWEWCITENTGAFADHARIEEQG